MTNSTQPVGPLVSVQWLSEHLDSSGVRVVDASWHLPNVDRNARTEFESEHIPSAVFFDIDGIAEPDTDLPHVVATPERFSSAVGALGISNEQIIVVYDSYGLFSAARVWWNFKIMGVDSVYVLDGGLPAWKQAGLPMTSGQSEVVKQTFMATPHAGAVWLANDVLQATKSSSAQIVDVRPAGRFSGEVPEPRPGLKSGHMPNAKSLPFPELIDNGRLRETQDLGAIFASKNIDLNQPIVATCGSGVTAPIIALALAKMGIEALQVYDGSWAEWGSRDDLPVVTGI